MTRINSLALLFWLATCGNLAAYEFKENPDRWISAELGFSGALPFTGETDIVSISSEKDQNTASKSISPALDVRLPVANAWTIEGTFSANFSQSKSDEAPQRAGSEGDSIGQNGLLSLRYYAVGKHLTRADVSQNPDEWPMIALRASENTLLRNQTSSSLNGVASSRSDATQTIYTGGLDLRLPLANRWTLLATGLVNWTRTESPATATLPEGRSTLVGPALTFGYRYYFVGCNYIAKDHQQNPDRWTSFAMTLSGYRSFDGRQTSFASQGEEDRDDLSETVSLNLEIRAPITDHLTLRFDVGGQYGHRATDQTPTAARTVQTISSITLGGGIRYYFF
jgi:hypothetical protein